MHRFGSEAIFFGSLDISGKVYFPGGEGMSQGDVSGMSQGDVSPPFDPHDFVSLLLLPLLLLRMSLCALLLIHILSSEM